ncbi:glutathione S-transferase family protein [Ideonella sp. BN130291]|uniref:glutathione S-transferase family protein n=1 Tax=Ideonella sp. BN130291 TaxID=3112940 RepID=UPI002E259E9D|nr:glutathione S-transferase family protein [Ideonella sp. BN130291]
MQLYFGNKNYSSWSLRPWLAMRQLGIPFDEVKLRLDFSEGSAFKATLERMGSPGKVPVLVDDGFVVWDTLAIAEYLNEQFPDKAVWPRGLRERARARSLCAEMHSGFSALRNHCPMNIEADLRQVGAGIWDTEADVRRDVARIEQLWGEQLAASGGPFLFGEFSAADAYFAPVATRLRTYGLPVSTTTSAYVDRIFALPAMQQWVSDALAEQDFLDFDEPYRKSR